MTPVAAARMPRRTPGAPGRALGFTLEAPRLAMFVEPAVTIMVMLQGCSSTCSIAQLLDFRGEARFLIRPQLSKHDSAAVIAI